MRIKYFAALSAVLIYAMILTSCQPILSLSTPTATPDPCSGWTCTLAGRVYAETAADDNRFSGIPITFEQVSNCSPTKGVQETATDGVGEFSFEVFLHDTDSFVITVQEENFALLEKKFGGFDCLYCHCSPIDLILSSK